MEDIRLFCMRWVLFSFSLGLMSCSPFSSNNSSTVLILLESFSEQDYLCSEPQKIEEWSSLQEVCGEWIRMTHAYTASDLTQTNVSSLLSGLPASQHRVFHNGAQGLSRRFQTLAEKAINTKMRTGFFSGGLPLVNKFGVSQGYETFSQSLEGKRPRLFRTFEETVHRALRWLDEEVGGAPFFMTLYGPDLLFRNRSVTDDLGREQPLNRTLAISGAL
jgi:hypothetical protein